MSITNHYRILIFALMLFSYKQVFSQNVCIDSILIDDSISKFMKYTDFLKTGIKVDSIRDSKPIDAYEPDSMLYVGSSIFWYDTRLGICDAQIIRFDKIKSLRLGRFLITNSTTLSDLSEMFPDNSKTLKAISLYKQSGTFTSCSIPVTDGKGNLWDMKILFIFKDKIIYQVEFWVPM